MGYINVELGGSVAGQFGMQAGNKIFTAMGHGHADAVARAIEYLSAEVLPRSIALDHELHGEGKSPDYGFTASRISKQPT
jgi:hypothetical protein